MRQIRLGQQTPPLSARSGWVRKFRRAKRLATRKCSVPPVQDLVVIYMLVDDCTCQGDGPAASMPLTIGDSELRSAGQLLEE